MSSRMSVHGESARQEEACGSSSLQLAGCNWGRRLGRVTTGGTLSYPGIIVNTDAKRSQSSFFFDSPIMSSRDTSGQTYPVHFRLICDLSMFFKL